MTATGGTLNFACGSFETLTQPLTPDAQGNFDVVATLKPSIPIGGPLPTIHLTGTVRGRTMTLHEVFASGQTGTTYTLTFGQAAPQFNGPCPA